LAVGKTYAKKELNDMIEKRLIRRVDGHLIFMKPIEWKELAIL